MSNTPIEVPSGKDAAYENFPVGSWLLPAALRPHVAAFYGFARAIDDIADTPALQGDEKIRRLDGFAAALRGEVPATGYDKAVILRESLFSSAVPPEHALDLIAAFKQDAVKDHYANWAELMAYCDLSAAPVGRYLIDLHGGSRHGYGPSDALCRALQVINHLQDCADDYVTLRRVYLPADWMAEAGAVPEDLTSSRTSPQLRTVFNRMLDATDKLLIEAGGLPKGILNRRLALEAAVIIRIAQALCALLRQRDPLAQRVTLSRPALAWCGVRGVVAGLF